MPLGVPCPAHLSSVLTGAQPGQVPSPDSPLERVPHADSARQLAPGPGVDWLLQRLSLFQLQLWLKET